MRQGFNSPETHSWDSPKLRSDPAQGGNPVTECGVCVHPLPHFDKPEVRRAECAVMWCRWVRGVWLDPQESAQRAPALRPATTWDLGMCCACACMYVHVCMQCTCGGERATYESQFSPSTMQVPEQTQVIGLGCSCLYLLNHPNSPEVGVFDLGLMTGSS